MKRLFPSSLLGQVMISVALALLVAQAISAALLFRAAEDRREMAALTTAAFRLVNGGERAERREARAMARANREARAQRRFERPPPSLRGAPGLLPPQLQYARSFEAPVSYPEFTGEGDREELLRSLLAQQGVDPHTVAIAVRKGADDPALVSFAERRPRLAAQTNWRERRVLVAAIQRTPDAEWEAARVFEPRPASRNLGGIALQTLVIFFFLMGILFVIMRRITRPLERLTRRVDDFTRHPDRALEIEESGPADIRKLISAHNAMEQRIAAMLDEKDVMLGAIGHDLKTPLAALRVRIESVPDDAQRARMADSIEDITQTLDDILTLARVGRATSGAEKVNLAALAQSIVEEFEDLGSNVTLGGAEKATATVQLTWIKRALRNLVGNAVRYGGNAQVSVLQDKGQAILRVLDDGPGIPAEQIEGMMEPFIRGEGSRNRATGGAGLGLTLARAIAQQHGGELVLVNRSEGGLRAEIRLPL